MVYAVDFDGTLFKDSWPDVSKGKPNWRVIKRVLKLQKKGNKLTLWTCRQGQKLLEAIEACKSVGIIFDNINYDDESNHHFWPIDMQPTMFRKIFADVYIDDRAVSPSLLSIICKKF